MLSDNDWYFILAMGVAGAIGLLVLLSMTRGGYGKRPAPSPSEHSGPLTDTDRHEMLVLLRQLTGWTSEYLGTVSQYQDRLEALAREVQQEAGASTLQSVSRVVSLLGEMTHSSAGLQQRLEMAEKQLDRQTHQLQSYLTEARTDALTQLANRRSFDIKIEELCSAHGNGDRSVVLAMVDIDHFKNINDAKGHPAGDAVLRLVATELRQSFDAADLVARYGGDEFALLLPGPLRAASEHVDAVRKRLAGKEITVAGQTHSVTLSCGLSEAKLGGDAAQLIRRADEALYAAKHMGRNRVCYHDGRQSVSLDTEGRPQ